MMFALGIPITPWALSSRLGVSVETGPRDTSLYWSWLWDILAFWGTTLIHFHFPFNQNLRFFEMYFLGVELCMLAPSATGRSFRAVGFMNGQRSTEVLPSLLWLDVTWMPRFRSFAEKDELHWNTLRFDISHAALLWMGRWAAKCGLRHTATERCPNLSFISKRLKNTWWPWSFRNSIAFGFETRV